MSRYDTFPAKNEAFIDEPLDAEELKKDAVDIRLAEEILGKELFVDPKKVTDCFPSLFDHENLPPIPFSQQELEAASKQGYYLIPRLKGLPDQRVTIDDLASKYGNIGFSDTLHSSVSEQESLRSGWALVSFEKVNGNNGDLLHMIDDRCKHLLEFYTKAGLAIPPEYSNAIKEFYEFVGKYFDGRNPEQIDFFSEMRGEAERETEKYHQFFQEFLKLNINSIMGYPSTEALYDCLLSEHIPSKKGVTYIFKNQIQGSIGTTTVKSTTPRAIVFELKKAGEKGERAINLHSYLLTSNAGEPGPTVIFRPS